jgi:hypothetical protein
MSAKPVPAPDHISRYCKPKTLGEDGQPSRTSFMLKPSESFLSVNWLEYYGDIGRESQLDKIRQHIQLSLAPTGKFAILNVGKTLKHIHLASGITDVSVLHEPTLEDPSHSGIHGYTHEQDLVADLLAEVVQEIYPAK